MFQTNVLDRIKTHFVQFFSFRKLYRLWGNVGKYLRGRQTTDDSICNTAQKVWDLHAG